MIFWKSLKLNVSNAGVRSVDKGSFDEFLKTVQNKNLSPRLKNWKKFVNKISISKKLSSLNQSNEQAIYSSIIFDGVVVLSSNYLVQFPVDYYDLSEILTYGAFSYPIAFLITDLANRSYGN